MVVIKSMARKQPTFAQLLSYFEHESRDGDERLTHNLIADPRDTPGLIAELEANAAFLPERTNGNYLYHEIISLPAGLAVSDEHQTKALLAITREYIKRRAPNQLVVGKLHRETNHFHMHLAISANEVHSSKRHWIRKTDLARIQMEVERYANQHFPELGLHDHYQRSFREDERREQTKISTRENALKRRTGIPSQKEQDHSLIKSIFTNARSEEALQQSLLQARFSLYKRGLYEGVINQATGRRYRLKTLGLEKTLLNARHRIKVFAERQQQLETWQALPRNHERGRDE